MNILWILSVIIFLIILGQRTEHFTRTINTSAATVDNYFTDLQCIDPTLPIARFRQGNTLEYYSLNGTTPMMMTDFGVSNVKCFKQKSDKTTKPDFNTYISTIGLRDKSTPTYKLFTDLGNNVYPNFKAINCTSNGMNDSNHICGKLYNAFINHPVYCPKDKFSKNPDCTNIQDNKLKSNGILNPINMLSLIDVQNIYAKQKCQSVDCLRKNGPPPSMPQPLLPYTPNSNGNCDLTTISRGVKSVIKNGDIKCAQAIADKMSYASSLETYNTKLNNYTNNFNSCLTSCDTVSSNIPNARYCNGTNNTMSFIGNKNTC